MKEGEEAIQQYNYIRIRKPQEMFVRADRYTIVRYYMHGEHRIRETLFYPSKFGIDEIKSKLKIKAKDLTPNERWLIRMYKQLIEEGKGDVVTTVRNPGKPLENEINKDFKLQTKSNRIRLNTIPTNRRPKLQTIEKSNRPKLEVKSNRPKLQMKSNRLNLRR